MLINNRTYIIAEAGVNHNGDVTIAMKLIDFAVEAGVDAVKFQSFKAENLVTRTAEKANYQKITSDKQESQYEMIKKLELSYSDHIELIEYCSKKGVDFLSSPFDLESIVLLDNLGLEIFKIPSGELINLPYLEAIGKLNKKVILSTGMSELSEVGKALEVLQNSGTNLSNIIVLHANTEYPTPMQDVNLNAMLTIKNIFKVEVGYSDHTKGIEVPIAAVALGAKVIEKHFTLDCNMYGPDHKASLEPDEIKDMVDSIRNIEKALGTGIKAPSESEMKNKKIARKSIVAKTRIKRGDVFTSENLTTKRPGYGISPMDWYKVIGCNSNRDYDVDDLIEI